MADIKQHLKDNWHWYAMTTGIVVALLLCVSNCSGLNKNKKHDEEQDIKIEEEAQIRHVADSILYDNDVKLSNEIDKVDKRVGDVEARVDTLENKVDTLEHKVDSAFVKIDECCDCNKQKKKPVIKPIQDTAVVVKTQPRDTVVPKPQPKPQPKSQPKCDTIVHIIKYDTVPAQKPKERQTTRTVEVTVTKTVELWGYGSHCR